MREIGTALTLRTANHRCGGVIAGIAGLPRVSDHGLEDNHCVSVAPDSDVAGRQAA